MFRRVGTSVWHALLAAAGWAELGAGGHVCYNATGVAAAGAPGILIVSQQSGCGGRGILWLC